MIKIVNHLENNNILSLLITEFIIWIIVSNLPLLTTHNLMGKEFNSGEDEDLEDEEE